MAFRCVGSPLDEMKRLEKLLERDPESAANLVANGKLLVDFVRDGNLRALQCAAEHLEEKTGYLRFMLLNSFDLQQSYMRDILHNIIENVEAHKVLTLCSHLFGFCWMLVSISIGKGSRICTPLCTLHAAKTCTPRVSTCSLWRRRKRDCCGGFCSFLYPLLHLNCSLCLIFRRTTPCHLHAQQYWADDHSYGR
ncbi:hypothetical protein GQ600_10520 [Phytophthora cactorum]|nr:hypothetical protein GQ600_10520 [Phytophthora cactorum]